MKFTLRDNFYEPLKSLSNEELGILLRATFSYLRGEEVKIPNELLTAWGYLYAQINIEVLKDKKTSQSRAQAGRRGMAKRWGNSKKASSSYNKENKCYKATESQALTKKEEEITNKNNNSNETSNNQALTMAKKMDNKDNACYKPAGAQIVTEEIAEEGKNTPISDNNININLSRYNIINKEKKEKVKEKKEKRDANFNPPTLEEVKAYILEQGYKLIDAERFLDFYQSKGWMVGRNKMKDWKAAVRNWGRTEKERRERKSSPNMNTGIILQDNINKFKNEKEDW